MIMSHFTRFSASLLTLALLAVAAPVLAEGHEAGVDDTDIISWRARYLALGNDVFDWVCAECHANVENEAPQIGQREDWEDRSPLWSAVLLEHVKEGYMEMPAKGGHPYLSDQAVQAAGEYMLGKTFPELPAD